MPTTQFSMQDGEEQHATYLRKPSNANWKLVYGAAGVKAVAVPADARRVLFSSTTDIVVAVDEAAVYPVADSVALDGGEFNPGPLWIKGATTISIATGAAGVVGLTFYK